MCSDLSEVAGNIRGISEHSMTSNRERPSGDWLSRQWFTEEVSQVAYMTDLFFLMIEILTVKKYSKTCLKRPLKNRQNNDLCRK